MSMPTPCDAHATSHVHAHVHVHVGVDLSINLHPDGLCVDDVLAVFGRERAGDGWVWMSREGHARGHVMDMVLY